MEEVYSYDIYVLGLKDPSSSGRYRFASTMERLTGRSSEEFEKNFPPSNIPILEAMNAERATETADELGNMGVLIEVRPTDKPPQEQERTEVTTQECPACKQIQPPTNDECLKCGIVFKKYEREQLVKMQKGHTLEQAMIKAMQIREEWMHRATQYLEQHKTAPGFCAAFDSELIKDEVPFLRLESEEGPILLTSRRLLSRRDNKFESVPYEMIREVDYGGGAIKTAKSKFRLQTIFHTPIPLKSGELAKNLAWHLDKDSSFSKEVVFEWGYARNFICGSCGERDLEYRTDEVRGEHRMFCRCMHCATDHEIDIAECLAIPLISE